MLAQKSYSLDLFSLGYVAGLLHDIGDAVLLTHAKTTHDLFEELQTRYDNITYQTLDFIQSGYNHVELGGLLAKKWRFPQILEQIIRYHHQPMMAPLKVRYLAVTVHMADLFLHYPDGDIPTVYLQEDALKLLGITSEQHLYMQRSLLIAKLNNDD